MNELAKMGDPNLLGMVQEEGRVVTREIDPSLQTTEVYIVMNFPHGPTLAVSRKKKRI